MSREPKKSWLPKGNKGSWSVRDSKTGEFASTREFECHHQSKSNSTKGVSGRITLPNGDSIKTVRRDVMDRALGRDSSKSR